MVFNKKVQMISKFFENSGTMKPEFSRIFQSIRLFLQNNNKKTNMQDL